MWFVGASCRFCKKNCLEIVADQEDHLRGQCDLNRCALLGEYPTESQRLREEGFQVSGQRGCLSSENNKNPKKWPMSLEHSDVKHLGHRGARL